MCDYSITCIRVTAVLEYLKVASRLPRGVVNIPNFYHIKIINTVRPIRRCVIMLEQMRCGLCAQLLLVNLNR